MSNFVSNEINILQIASNNWGVANIESSDRIEWDGTMFGESWTFKSSDKCAMITYYVCVLSWYCKLLIVVLLKIIFLFETV